MSIRRRSVAGRVALARQWDEAWARSTAAIDALHHVVTTAIADRDGHRRMDEDGAPVPAKPFDPYAELVAGTRALSA